MRDVDEMMQEKIDADEDRHYDKQWFVDVVVTVYAPDIFKAHQEAEAKLKSMMGEGSWGIVKVSDRLGEDDDE